ncbi:MAG: hypothetical protein ACP6IP_05505 [Candidatus Njordarchaeia archaeon]
MFINMKDDYNRAYFSFLTEEVRVSPNKTFEINFFGRKYRFVQGEESSLPRWIAEILKDKDMLQIKEDIEIDKIISDAVQLTYTEKRSTIIESSHNIILRLKEFISRAESGQLKNNASAILKKLIDLRSLKILKSATKPYEEEEEEVSKLDPLERILYFRVRMLYESWRKIIVEE